MNIVVTGPGAIGCLFACFLARTNNRVMLLDRRPERADTIMREGIRLHAGGGERGFMIPAFLDAREAGPADILFICVKSYDVASAIETSTPCLSANTLVVSFQNGLGNIETLSARVPPERVLAAVTTNGALCLGPGQVRHTGIGTTTVGPADPRAYPAAELVAKLLREAGQRASAVKDIEPMLWSKLVINSAICPVSAVSGLPNGELPGHPQWGETLRAAAREAEATARAKGIKLLYKDAVAAALDVCEKTASNLSSMLQDIKKGKPTEIEAINGAVIRDADAMSVPVPTLKMLRAEVLKITRG